MTPCPCFRCVRALGTDPVEQAAAMRLGAIPIRYTLRIQTPPIVGAALGASIDDGAGRKFAHATTFEGLAARIIPHTSGDTQ